MMIYIEQKGRKPQGRRMINCRKGKWIKAQEL
jgi:hypothetical protein